MAATAHSSHYHREERSTYGQPAYGGGDRAIQQTNWDSHLGKDHVVCIGTIADEQAACTA